MTRSDAHPAFWAGAHEHAVAGMAFRLGSERVGFRHAGRGAGLIELHERLEREEANAALLDYAADVRIEIGS